MTGARVTAIVVHWRSGAFIADCLAALAEQDCPLAIIVVDNDDDAALRARLTARLPQLRWLVPGGNSGFAAANNLAINACATEYVMLVNPDVVLAPDHVRLLVAALDADGEAGSATGHGLVPGTEPPLLDGMGHFLTRARTTSGCRTGSPAERETPGLRFGVCAGYALYRRAMLEDVAEPALTRRCASPPPAMNSGRGNGRELMHQYFDEKLFAYFEDVDLDWRAQWRGWTARYVPEALAWHARGGSGGMRQRDIAIIHAANRWLVWLKNDALLFAVRDYGRLGGEFKRDYQRWRRDNLAGEVLKRIVRLAPAMLAQRAYIAARRRRPAAEMAAYYA